MHEHSPAWKLTSFTSDVKASNVSASAKVMKLMLRLHILLGFFFVFIGTNYAGLAIDLLAGRNFSNGSAPLVLSAYCIYVPIMGVNGITEAYVQALAGEKVLMRQSYWMGICWVAFLFTGYFSISSTLAAGAIGIVIANSVNLLLRIWFSWSFIRKHFLVDVLSRCKVQDNATAFQDELDKTLQLRSLFPQNPLLWVGFALVWGVTFTSNTIIGWNSLKAKLLHLSVGVLSFALVSGLT
jgi:oligosaccharide translocation protein RFT1